MKERKTRQINFRVTPSDEKMLREVSISVGEELSQFIRTAALNRAKSIEFNRKKLSEQRDQFVLEISSTVSKFMESPDED